MNKTAIFGRRTEPHTIVIAKGSHIRHFTLRPWVAALAGSVLLAASCGYLVATGYLIMRDDIIDAALMRQARVQHTYEDRIAALRVEVDRITSHRLLDQQFIERKIAELANRQSALAQRSGALMPLVERARATGVMPGAVPDEVLPIPAQRPDRLDGTSRKASLAPSMRGSARVDEGAAPTQRTARLPGAGARDGFARLGQVDTTLDELETNQFAQLSTLTRAALAKRNELIETARANGLSIDAEPVQVEAVGGPFVPYAEDMPGQAFVEGLQSLQAALDALDQARGEVSAYPIAHPVPGQAITSGFGKRRDPIIGRSAFHAGIDFRAPTGTPIRATAAGKVVTAGRNGGYGKMVEIDHGNGLTTRFAHMSRIDVKRGQRVVAGQKIGASGNTGRSTGPHLHYEVRAGERAVDPMRYLRAGNKLGAYL
ncbi:MULTISPECIES: M23 family metallopeptidase [unclassified Roseitalea]|uniref:M23 family metallopeptidase n=1 Tax=unclassified Roseitalea TaxID=2639107 RepID=UPI00273D0BF5|nr:MULTISPECIES: M23 family metallopeptidase [unclassified Roseitalea]